MADPISGPHGKADVREMVDTTRTTFARLGATPFLAHLDAALTGSPNQARRPR